MADKETSRGLIFILFTYQLGFPIIDVISIHFLFLRLLEIKAITQSEKMQHILNQSVTQVE